MAINFTRLIKFIYVSSAYACSFLPNGPVEEVYPIVNADQVFEDIFRGRQNKWPGYAWPIGPAIEQPHELYGFQASIPLNNFFSRLLSASGGAVVLQAAAGSASGGNILDETPVDLVANIMLQHDQIGTEGVIHACSRSYIPKDFGFFHRRGPAKSSERPPRKDARDSLHANPKRPDIAYCSVLPDGPSELGFP
ncbi:uncharacterized protein BCR38DRAFT_413368 [Pseudomassariella vexata]|uniref:Uncharacterized protein n=1 Tax=Pseudomassariella vexata TaxID=1141098 RepID=A0A1Y2DHA7_9PEZI|nr:uncharacterized protein BCR38DRAFT_413368 [Pseudomassariella vexata]ORY58516.1 hypothetical protein BCR38DRAFT_413368 [Pseudomassariella vexata]